LTRGFQFADDQFQALQTQVTEGFQSIYGFSASEAKG